jgi:hypothetical protein
VRRIYVGSCDLTHTIITTSERIGHWTKTRRFLARFSRPESSIHTRYLVDFTITTSGLGFWYTQVSHAIAIRHEAKIETFAPRSP